MCKNQHKVGGGKRKEIELKSAEEAVLSETSFSTDFFFFRGTGV
jgi:hypothetical protein